MIKYGPNKYATGIFLLIVFVYTLSINALDVSQTIFGKTIFRAKPDVIIETELKEGYIELYVWIPITIIFKDSHTVPITIINYEQKIYSLLMCAGRVLNYH